MLGRGVGRLLGKNARSQHAYLASPGEPEQVIPGLDLVDVRQL